MTSDIRLLMLDRGTAWLSCQQNLDQFMCHIQPDCLLTGAHVREWGRTFMMLGSEVCVCVCLSSDRIEELSC